MAAKNAFYAQSGGVTAVINASACGVVETARQHPDAIGEVYAGRNGIIGALNEELIDTSVESQAAIGALKYTPGAVRIVPLQARIDRPARRAIRTAVFERMTSASSSTTAAGTPRTRRSR